MHHLHTHQPHAGRYADQQQTHHHYPLGTEARDQFAGKKARREHGDHMPLQTEVGGFRGVAMHMHGQRGSGHQEVHQGVGNGAASGGGNKARLPGNGAKRSTTLDLFLHRFRQPHAEQNKRGEHGHHGLSEKGDDK